MAQATHDLSDDQIVQAYHDHFGGGWRDQPFDTDRPPRADGQAWINGDNTIVLFGPDLSVFGYVDTDEFEPAEYVDTRTVDGGDSDDDHKGYAFTAGDGVSVVDVEYVRDLANEVFDVSYDVMKRNAHTVPDADYQDAPEGITPVLFDVPNTQFRVMIAPLLGE